MYTDFIFLAIFLVFKMYFINKDKNLTFGKKLYKTETS